MAADVVTLTEHLVSLDTAPGRPTGPLAQDLAERLSALGAAVRLQEGAWEGVPQRNVVARLGGDGPAGLVLAGHIDTVPWEAGQKSTATPARDGRTLYGRGTCDMKGPIAAQLVAAERLAQRLRRPLVLLYSYAEEVGCHGAMDLVRRPAEAGDLSGAVAIVGEPTGGVPILAHKGYAVAKVRFAGAAAHSSNPAAGADASVALGVFLTEIAALRARLVAEADPDCGLEPPFTTLNTGVIRAGTAENVIPDRAELLLEWRPTPGFDSDELRGRVAAALRRACAAAPGVRSELDWPEPLPPFRQAPDAPFVSWLVERTGQPPGTVAFYTEAEIYRAGLGVPTVVCGPGSITQAHKVDESILFDELEAGVELYADAIAAFCA